MHGTSRPPHSHPLPVILFPWQILGAMYTVGIIVASFVFASLAQTFNEMRLLGYGMLIWSGGVLGTGLSDSFGAMLFCRVGTAHHVPCCPVGCSVSVMSAWYRDPPHLAPMPP